MVLFIVELQKRSVQKPAACFQHLFKKVLEKLLEWGVA